MSHHHHTLAIDNSAVQQLNDRPRPTSRIEGGAMSRFLVAMTATVAALASLMAAPAGAQETPTCNGVPATIVGSVGNDRLDGTPGNDVIVGLEGNDVIRGFGGNDIICGGNGRDRLFGGEGNDTILGGKKNDIIKGDQGRDTLFGNQGNDRIIGGGGIDTIDGGSGVRDALTGKGGADTCTDAQTFTTRYFTCENGVPIVSLSPISITRTTACDDTTCSTIAPTLTVTFSGPHNPQQVITTGPAQQMQTTQDVPVVFDLATDFAFNPGWTMTVVVRDDWTGRTSSGTFTGPAVVQNVAPGSLAGEPDLRFGYSIDVVTG